MPRIEGDPRRAAWLPRRQYIYGGTYIDELLIFDDDSDGDTNWDRYYYCRQLNYNIVALTDAGGTRVEKIKYDPYGEAAVTQEPGKDATGNPYLFQGRRWDDDADLYYFRNRWYSPRLGRFLQRDPAGYVDGMNLYAVMRGNPVRRLDPYGRQAEDCRCGPDITDAIAAHLNDFIQQQQGDLSWLWFFGARELERYARGNGWAGSFGSALAEMESDCGSGKCAGTVTLCDMCISPNHIDHILIIVYIAESYGTRTARSAGQYQESFATGFVTEGRQVEGSSDLVSNADLMFNEVAICISKALKHADANKGTADLVTREEICACTRAVTEVTRKAISQKRVPARGGTDYHNCAPCPDRMPKPSGLRLPPIDL